MEWFSGALVVLPLSIGVFVHPTEVVGAGVASVRLAVGGSKLGKVLGGVGDQLQGLGAMEEC
jgi:hypothetical protein